MKVTDLLKILKQYSENGYMLENSELAVEDGEEIAVKINKQLSISDLILLYSYHNAKRFETNDTIKLLFYRYAVEIDLLQYKGLHGILSDWFEHFDRTYMMNVKSSSLARCVLHRLLYAHEYDNPITVTIEGDWPCKHPIFNQHSNNLTHADVYIWDKDTMVLRVINSGLRPKQITIDRKTNLFSDLYNNASVQVEDSYRLDRIGYGATVATDFYVSLKRLLKLTYLVYGKEPNKVTFDHLLCELIKRVEGTYNFNSIPLPTTTITYLDYVAAYGPNILERIENSTTFYYVLVLVAEHVNTLLRTQRGVSIIKGVDMCFVAKLACSHMSINDNDTITIDIEAVYNVLSDKLFLVNITPEDVIAGNDVEVCLKTFK